MTRAMERLTLTHAMARSLFGRRDYNLASRFLDELPQEVERDRLRPSSWSGYGVAGGRRDRAATRASRSRPATRCATARSARASSPRSSRAESLRFASPQDGTERRLMVEYAPLERIVDVQGRAVRGPRGVRPGRLRDRAVLRARPDERAHGALLEEPPARAHARRRARTGRSSAAPARSRSS